MTEKTIDFETSNNTLDKSLTESATDATLPDSSSLTLSDINQASVPAETQPGGRGSLIVQATTAGGAIPVQGADVTISSSSGDVIAARVTDNSGRTSKVFLEAPSIIYSQTPGSVRPYSTYNVRIEAPGYFTQNLLNIAVFDRIESIQPVILEPLGEDQLEDDRLLK